MLENDDFRLFPTALQCKSIASKIVEQEENLHMILHLAHVHRFVVRSILKFLLAHEIAVLSEKIALETAVLRSEN